VQVQDYGGEVEHVIVSDGPDPDLRKLLARNWLDKGYYELPGHHPDPHYGHYARLAGLELVSGDYITYCDDDDSLRPEHCRVMAAALDADPGAGFAVSRMVSHDPGGSQLVIGRGPLGCGNVGTPMIMHRRSVIEHGTWGPASQFEDWELVERWIAAGIRHVNVDAETSDVWPSRFR
jgi:glycosyltransferase involved in cell wall biosynthesis